MMTETRGEMKRKTETIMISYTFKKSIAKVSTIVNQKYILFLKYKYIFCYTFFKSIFAILFLKVKVYIKCNV